jgi:hypothetical protein
MRKLAVPTTWPFSATSKLPDWPCAAAGHAAASQPSKTNEKKLNRRKALLTPYWIKHQLWKRVTRSGKLA